MLAPILKDLPQKIERPSAWTAHQMESNPNRWLYQLTDDDISDLEQAASHYLTLGRDIGEIDVQSFPLTHFARHMASLKSKLLSGVGVEVLRGLPVASYSQEMAAAIFCGIGAHIGSARSQNSDGHVLGHVRDIGADANDPNSRIYQTNQRQTFHTDSADVVGLLCIREAKSGGKSLLVSAESVYNRLRAEHPDLLPLLFDPISTDRRGEIPTGQKPFMDIPVLSWHVERLTVFYQRQYIDSAQRFENAFSLTEKHIEALDAFDSLSNNPELYLSMQLQPGDMQFVYNHSQLHDRTGFLDWPEPEKRRHMMRLWLSPQGDRALPPVFAQRYGSVVVGNRGGIVTTNTRLHAPLN